MATTKPAATKKSASRRSEKEALVVKTREQLVSDLAVKQQDMLEARKGHRSGELVNPRVITHTRKEIARLKTAIRAIELKGDK